jgi:nucleoid DNA-binding protein
MNKTKFIEELSNKTGISKDICEEINKILESTFLIGKNNKDKILNTIKEKFNFDDEKVNKIYDTAMDILGSNLLDKIKNPFKSND